MQLRMFGVAGVRDVSVSHATHSAASSPAQNAQLGFVYWTPLTQQGSYSAVHVQVSASERVARAGDARRAAAAAARARSLNILL